MRIEQTASESETIFTLIGRITSPDVQQLKAEIDAVYFLAAVERKGIVLRQVPPYVREWIRLEKTRVALLE